jgi:hypothetical protein
MAQKVVNALPAIKEHVSFQNAVIDIANKAIKEDPETQKNIRLVAYDSTFCDYMTEKINRNRDNYNGEMIDLMSKIRNNESIDNHPFLTKMSPIKQEKLIKEPMETQENTPEPVEKASKGFLSAGVEILKAKDSEQTRFRTGESESPSRKSRRVQSQAAPESQNGLKTGNPRFDSDNDDTGNGSD